MRDDQLEIGEDHVRGLFDEISAGDSPPAADLVPAAVAAARRARRRRAIASTVAVGVLVAVGSLAVVRGETGTGAPRTPAAGSGPSAEVTTGQSALTRECTGVYLPWSSGSDASMYGKGSDAQRTTICERDLTALRGLLPGLAVSQSTQPYGPGVQDGEIMPDQVAEMGPGMKQDTPVLYPWQYTVAAHGGSVIINIEYGRDTNALELCGPCDANTRLANGFTLVDVIADSSTGRSAAGVQLKTPQGQAVVIYVSLLAAQGAPSVDPVKLAESPAFTAMLAADLALIGEN